MCSTFHSLIKHLLWACYIPGTGLWAGMSQIRCDLGPHGALEVSFVNCLPHTLFPQVLSLLRSAILGDSFPSSSGVQDSSSYV